MRQRWLSQLGNPALRGAGFTPLSLGSLATWWDADDHGTARMTDDGAGLISSWTDRVAGLAITAATTARPTWTANAFNTSYAGLTFDGTANCFVTTTLTAIPTGANAGWAMVVVAPTTSVTLYHILSYGGTANGSLRSLRKTSADGGQVTDGTTGVNTTGNFKTPNMLYGDWSGTAENGYLNGSLIAGSPATIGSLNTGTTRFRLGASDATSPGSFTNGVIRHLFIGTGTLSTTDRQNLEAWVRADSGL